MVIFNPQKVRKSWYHLPRILRREGEYPRMSGILYLTVVQAVLLFGAEMWVLTPRIGCLLGSLHNRLVRRLVGTKIRRRTNGIWDYPPLEDALKAVGLEMTETYIF